MVDPKKAAKLIRQHFEQLTTEQFVSNLHRSCPELFEEQKRSPKHNSSDHIDSDEVKPTKANI